MKKGQKFVIQGKVPLKGEIKVAGNKNAVLPLMAATLLTSEDCFLENVPDIEDVETMAGILKKLGAKVEKKNHDGLLINTRGVSRYELDEGLVEKLRASILFLGPLLARFGRAVMKHPGGCLIGKRAVGTHFEALESLGVETVTMEKNYESRLLKPNPAEIFLDEASVTATENAMMLASSFSGETVIEDAACEPQVRNLSDFLIQMGVKIDGAGTNRLVIHGQKKLTGAKIAVIPDPIEVGTLAIATVITGGEVLIKGIIAQDLKMILLYLKRMGINFRIEKDNLLIEKSRLKAAMGKIQTRPWPGFPTDLMSPLIVLATQASGVTLCHDWMYESRIFFVDKLVLMGANVVICDPHRVIVSGPTPLYGRKMETPDIRAGIALVIAALAAEGESLIENAWLIDRGYEKIEERLGNLGAKIKRVF